MSLLFPIYFAGALAIGLPILFHLIRRQPKGNVHFSSLMFLRPTPPRLTRRSRLDNWPLLLCRALALLLLAAAFTRPFFRSAASTELAAPGKRVVIAIDTSASMKRSGVWEDAINAVNELVAELSSNDEIAIVAFDQTPEVLFRFEQSRVTSTDRAALIQSSIEGLAPTWKSTDLGTVIPFCAELASTYESEESESVRDLPASLILVSDMQSGSGIEKLQSFAWPESLRLEVRQITAKETSNAWAQVLSHPADASDRQPSDVEEMSGNSLSAGSRRGEAATDHIRVRVSNSESSDRSRFDVAWVGADNALMNEQSVQVLPGQSQIIRMPRPENAAVSIRVSGDEVDFDNDRYFVDAVAKEYELLLLENEPEQIDPRDSLAYYIDRVPLGDERRSVTVNHSDLSFDAAIDVNRTALVVVVDPIDDASMQQLQTYAESGGTVLFVVTAANAQWQRTAATALASPDLQVTEAKVNDYAMLSNINFRHPLFSAMADPQFNDFTKVRFWSCRALEGIDDEVEVLASFDNEAPAVLQRSVGRGRVVVMAAGWQPNESQLALSTKFIPLMFNLVEMGVSAKDDIRSYFTGEQIDVATTGSTTIVRPSGEVSEIESDDELWTVDEPGIYQRTVDGVDDAFAVNLAESESLLEPIDISLLERFGINLADWTPKEVKLADERQMRDIELESNQKLWQWLLIGSMMFLGGELLLVRRQT
ncbi:N-terminal double-transmembrane domain-containing protein [Neorhodopirellula lusitana]|uniref:N-terminal double-transmembrane domain-containing protein n=1 Tax=Neorhodopirellula lusitana TaxID=445327 RepID=A0ABY1QTH4_9BACT|nr:BatA domain-containing protein [Neorhodopirellula lusitana]SMP78473.1 N-terminal double-transmembrane domain-containing protein [Neorhodopirellula lusitana]